MEAQPPYGYGESLGEYFVKRNDHLLGDVKVIEVAASQPRFLYGQPIWQKHFPDGFKPL